MATKTPKSSKQNKPTETPSEQLGQAGADVPMPLPSIGTTFAIEPESPFPDGYSIAGEREALGELLEADDAESDPRWPRVLELERREALLTARRDDFQHRRGADKLVTDDDVAKFKRLGNLVDDDETPDVLTVHTLQAWRLFAGKTRDPEGKTQPIPGGKRQGWCLRKLWYLTERDNPFAEWALLLHERMHAETLKTLKEQVAQAKQAMDALRERGFKINLQRSSSPEDLVLGFRSPYSYAVGELLMEFDLFVRYVSTLERKDQLSGDDARQRIRAMSRRIRGNWIRIIRFTEVLTRPELEALGRGDFLPSADELAGKRIDAAVQLLGAVPVQILVGALVPRHTRRKGAMTVQERALLEEIASRRAAPTLAPAPQEAIAPE